MKKQLSSKLTTCAKKCKFFTRGGRFWSFFRCFGPFSAVNGPFRPIVGVETTFWPYFMKKIENYFFWPFLALFEGFFSPFFRVLRLFEIFVRIRIWFGRLALSVGAVTLWDESRGWVMRIGGVWGHKEAIQANFEPSKAPNELRKVGIFSLRGSILVIF